MKKVFITLLGLLFLTGCSFNFKEEEKTIYTTYYPILYATKYMYDDAKIISSIYPNEADVMNYELTKKQKENYANSNIFVYVGVTDEVKLAVDFLNINHKLNIIDATNGLTMNKSVEELWLNPANYLMIARNIKTTLIDYETNAYNVEKITNNYEKLKIDISELDVEYTMMSNSAARNTILVADDALNYLSKYNINVLSIDSKNDNYSKAVNEAKKLIQSKDIQYIYIIKGKALTDEINSFITTNNLEKIEIDPMYTLSENQRKNNDTYITIMKENIEKFKTELFR